MYIVIYSYMVIYSYSYIYLERGMFTIQTDRYVLYSLFDITQVNTSLYA